MSKFEQSIAQDVASLESILDTCNNQYRATPKLQGKKWYGIGLEDNESNAQKDNINKKGIIAKMIDIIIKFIDKIIVKIKSFYSDKKSDEIKSSAEAFKNYKGLGNTVKAASSQSSSQSFKSKQETPNPKESVDNTPAGKLFKKMSLYQIDIFTAMMDKDYHTAYTEMMSKVEDVVQADPDFTELEEYTSDLDNIHEIFGKCREIINKSKNKSDELKRRLIDELVDGNLQLAALTPAYFEKTQVFIAHNLVYMEKFKKEIERLKQKDTDEVFDELQRIRDFNRTISMTTSHATSVLAAATTVGEALRNLST